MTAGLLAGVAGLALIDALNPATIAGVALLLFAPMGQRVLEIAREIRGHRGKMPGFGHPIHHPVDPRTERILALADEQADALLRRGDLDGEIRRSEELVLDSSVRQERDALSLVKRQIRYRRAAISPELRLGEHLPQSR